MKRNQLIQYLDHYLRLADIQDYGPQGLQVESANEEIRRVALAVDVAPPIIEAAAGWEADLLLVHHGLLWRSVERIAGPLGSRVRALMAAGINLYAAHLSLDAHPEVGNNAVLARMFGLEQIESWGEIMGTQLGVIGQVPPVSLEQFVQLVDRRLETTARVLAGGLEMVRRVAILSGAGADLAGAARALGADTYLTGETAHTQYWRASDHGLNVIYAGHYATETVGVRALGDHLQAQFGLDIRFFDFPTGM